MIPSSSLTLTRDKKPRKKRVCHLITSTEGPQVVRRIRLVLFVAGQEAAGSAQVEETQGADNKKSKNKKKEEKKKE